MKHPVWSSSKHPLPKPPVEIFTKKFGQKGARLSSNWFQEVFLSYQKIWFLSLWRSSVCIPEPREEKMSARHEIFVSLELIGCLLPLYFRCPDWACPNVSLELRGCLLPLYFRPCERTELWSLSKLLQFLVQALSIQAPRRKILWKVRRKLGCQRCADNNHNWREDFNCETTTKLRLGAPSLTATLQQQGAKQQNTVVRHVQNMHAHTISYMLPKLRWTWQESWNIIVTIYFRENARKHTRKNKETNHQTHPQKCA